MHKNDIQKSGCQEEELREETGCKSGYLFSIKTIEGKFIGVLGIDFTKRKTKLDDDVINNIMIQCSSLGGVLMNHLQV